MNSGIFIVNKPAGLSTNQLIQKIKKNLTLKKVGHAGTLDPLATGVVLVLVNQATKISQFLLGQDKKYLVKIRLFLATTTSDAEGTTTQRDSPFPISGPTLKKVLTKYQNYTYEQTPPIFSAIKVQGKKLYQYALNQETVAISPRLVTIKKTKLVAFKTPDLTLEVTCSKGTYIRSLAVDLAADLKTVGYVKTLARLSSGNFTSTMAKNWDALTSTDLIPLYETLKIAGWPMVEFASPTLVLQGQKIQLPNCREHQVFIINKEKEVLAVYERVTGDWFKCLRGGLNQKGEERWK